ncbi:hypothetical protein [Nocardia sp. NBC_01327]|uniref:hypothetical protein n=1 Tax=Nocardia sp. NBC_01327 TaxID=2903593 RepID=UPI002E12B133|nr:hypothetical protein OG326_20355 [Nocardia sp. NBC_01327]
MFRTPHPALGAVLIAATGCLGFTAALASAQQPASISVDRQMSYNVTTLTINGSATCAGGGTAGVNIANGSLEQMFQGGIGGPIAVQLDGSVLVTCDGAPHNWSGRLIAPGRALPTDSGGTVTANLSQGSTVIATTGAQGVYIAH